MNKTKSGTAGKTAVLNYNETIVRNGAPTCSTRPA